MALTGTAGVSPALLECLIVRIVRFNRFSNASPLEAGETPAVPVSRPNFLTPFVVQPLARERYSEHPGRSEHLSQHESLFFFLH
jgi:hypothetical protein